MFRKFPFVHQYDMMDCGPACLSMIARKYGKQYPLEYLRDRAYYTREGVSLTGLTEAASAIGFESAAVKLTVERLIDEVPLPCILFWNEMHFVVLYKIRKKLLTGEVIFEIADPNSGFVSVNQERLVNAWVKENDKGVAFLLEPTQKFYSLKEPAHKTSNLRHLLGFLSPFKKEILQLFISLSAGSLFALIFPFLTQSLIDKGLSHKDVNLVFIILLAQLSLFAGTVAIEIIRNWILLYLGARINISIISQFFRKILKLPIHFFDTKFLGDFYQRIYDHKRIETFLTSQSLTTFFSLVNFSIFFFVLLYYDYKILLAYSFLTAVAITCSLSFSKRRERLDYFRFKTNALNQESINEMINGIQEIKMNNFEDYKIESWENIQIESFNINIKVLKIDQLQLLSYDFINQFKNIIVTFIAAREVIQGNLTLGAMLSIAYIIGQMNSPVNQLILFFRSLQDAQLSMDRMAEIQNHQDEEVTSHVKLLPEDLDKKNSTPKGIRLTNVSFRYEGPQSPYVLKDIDLFIPEGKITAIVGGSGSGKSTLIKLLLKFYAPTSGTVSVNQYNLLDVSPVNWRRSCGVVTQEGYIFSDTIERNIATSEVDVDEEKFDDAVRIANIGEFIDSLPLKEKTKIGSAGNGISGGQKQRILIARAVYKKPHFILLDEATSALDTENEKIIHDNLKEFFRGKTVVIVAHRLSTVKNADQIIVLRNGQIAEQGSHNSLVNRQGEYFNLVRNQLELEV